MVLRFAAVAASAAVIGAMSSSASAELFDYTLTGAIDTLRDTTGTFALLTKGDPFTLVFRADTTLGRLSIASFGTGGGSSVYGGSKYIGTSDATYWPGVVVSPVSAVLFVDGHSMTLTGENFGQIELFNSYLPGTVGASGGDFRAQGQTRVGSYVGGSIVDASFSSDHLLPLPILTQPFTIALDGPGMSASVFLDRELTDPTTHRTIETIGSFHATSLVGAAVPEPAAWAMLVAGFTLAGTAIRRRRYAQFQRLG